MAFMIVADKGHNIVDNEEIAAALRAVGPLEENLLGPLSR
jgi:hypothetical protein